GPGDAPRGRGRTPGAPGGAHPPPPLRPGVDQLRRHAVTDGRPQRARDRRHLRRAPRPVMAPLPDLVVFTDRTQCGPRGLVATVRDPDALADLAPDRAGATEGTEVP